jgi:hypothetical protein
MLPAGKVFPCSALSTTTPQKKTLRVIIGADVSSLVGNDSSPRARGTLRGEVLRAMKAQRERTGKGEGAQGETVKSSEPSCPSVASSL